MKYRNNWIKRFAVIGCCLLLSVNAAACTRGAGISADTQSEAEQPAGDEAEGSNSGSTSDKAKNAGTQAARYEESIAADPDELGSEESPYYGIMYVSVLDVNGNVGDSDTVYSFRDRTDPENIWSVTGLEIGDIESDMSEGTEVVVLFNGDIINDAENLKFIAVLPAGSYELKAAEGTLAGNTMSLFSVETADGRIIDFLKDNCLIDDDAMKSDRGDKIRVYYADGGELGNFPLRVVSAVK